MASHQLIDDYLADLARRLPADTVDELGDGLIETWRHHIATGLAPEPAARAATADFGTADQITDAFVKQAPGRRNARLLLATAPILGACWGSSLIAAKAWTWPIPTLAAVTYALALLAIVTALTAAATSRHSYRRTKLGIAGALGLIILDMTMLATVLFVAPTLVWPMAAAIPASLARTGLTLHSLPVRPARQAWRPRA